MDRIRLFDLVQGIAIPLILPQFTDVIVQKGFQTRERDVFF